jgi:hypothetical protein
VCHRGSMGVVSRPVDRFTGSGLSVPIGCLPSVRAPLGRSVSRASQKGASHGFEGVARVGVRLGGCQEGAGRGETGL